MLIAVALAAWSAASVASAIPEDIMSSGHGINSRNASYSIIADSNAKLEASNYTDVCEERVILPTEFNSILGKWHASMLQELTEDKQKAMIPILVPMINAMNEAFARLTLATGKGNILQSPDFPQWIMFVKNMYSDPPESANAAMFVMLADHFPGDKLVEVLVGGTKIDTAKDFVEIMLDLQVSAWVKGEKSAAEVFKLLELEQTNGNLFESALFSKWVTFAESRYKQAANDVMFFVLADHCKDDDLARFLVAKTKIGSTKDIAEKLLDAQVKEWARIGRDDAEIFRLLDLEHPEGKLFESPLYTKWKTFVVLKYGSSKEANEIMFKFLSSHCRGDDLARALVEGTKSKRTMSEAKKQLEDMIKDWVLHRRNAADIFELLQLHLTKGKSSSRPLYSTWLKFVRVRYAGKPRQVINETLQAFKQRQHTP